MTDDAQARAIEAYEANRAAFVPVTALMDLPGGRDEVGRDPALDGERAFDHAGHPVVGTCETCDREIHEGVTGHVCADGFRSHRDGEGIAPVEAV